MLRPASPLIRKRKASRKSAPRPPCITSTHDPRKRHIHPPRGHQVAVRTCQHAVREEAGVTRTLLEKGRIVASAAPVMPRLGREFDSSGSIRPLNGYLHTCTPELEPLSLRGVWQAEEQRLFISCPWHRGNDSPCANYTSQALPDAAIALNSIRQSPTNVAKETDAKGACRGRNVRRHPASRCEKRYSSAEITPQST